MTAQPPLHTTPKPPLHTTPKPPLDSPIAATVNHLSPLHFPLNSFSFTLPRLHPVTTSSVDNDATNTTGVVSAGKSRPKYRGQLETDREQLPVQELKQQPEIVGPLLTDSASTTLQAIVIWDSFFKAYEEIGVELFQSRAIGLQDIESWKDSHNKIVSTGIPAYTFLECFLRSIKIGSPGFVLRNDVEITSVNRPEGRLLDWLYEPMSVMKAQIKHMDLTESEERYLYAHCLYAGDMEKIEGWRNGGTPPSDVIRRAQLEGISRRLQGLCLTLSRMPTSRRRFFEVVKKIEQEARTLHES
ncbi:hypothetical protein KSS87_014542 [Heliosperma pusillum]|nr:hypothetical protein KSS87_014542 [Heliosperma pusillum]